MKNARNRKRNRIAISRVIICTIFLTGEKLLYNVPFFMFMYFLHFIRMPATTNLVKAYILVLKYLEKCGFALIQLLKIKYFGSAHISNILLLGHVICSK